MLRLLHQAAVGLLLQSIFKQGFALVQFFYLRFFWFLSEGNETEAETLVFSTSFLVLLANY